MAYLLNAGLALSLNGTTWYEITDHNRQPMQISTTLIEKESRMANGTMRKFIVSKKDTISTSWENVPSLNKPTYTITNLVAQSGILVYTTSGNHNFANNSEVRVSGFSDSRFNLISSVSVATGPQSTFAITGKYSGENLTLSGTNLGTAEAETSIATVDGKKGAAWLSAFYNANAGIPVYLKVTSSKMSDPSIGQVPTDTTFLSSASTSKVYNVFMTNFSTTISKRTKTTDYVDMSIEFVEI